MKLIAGAELRKQALYRSRLHLDRITSHRHGSAGCEVMIRCEKNVVRILSSLQFETPREPRQ